MKERGKKGGRKENITNHGSVSQDSE